MARIRTIKPEFWTSEQVMNLSPMARLLFIGLWNFCDDAGIHPAGLSRLKAEVFPNDAISLEDCRALIDETIAQGLIEKYHVESKDYWRVTGWEKHQRIDKPTYKHPARPNSNSAQGELSEKSTNTTRAVAAISKTESNGVDKIGMDVNNIGKTNVMPINSRAVDICPHAEIIDTYHRILPTGRLVREWNAKRQSLLKARWRESVERQCIDWWENFFTYISKSDFLTGKINSGNNSPFQIDLEWIVNSSNFVKIIEGKYENRSAV